MPELNPWSAWNTFASLQATAKDFAGLNNARLLISEAKKIRCLRREQIADEMQREQLITEALAKEDDMIKSSVINTMVNIAA